jgi:DNA-binding transcriptional regulator YiaG
MSTEKKIKLNPAKIPAKSLKIIEKRTMTPISFRTLREEMGLTQSQLAKLLSVDISTISRWESSGGTQARKAPASVYMLTMLMAIQTHQLSMPSVVTFLQETHP